ncbi:Fanconi-associated nuclease 1 [Zea mays]|uniref:Fanconi-associated nuclease n=1 Tax=Zea mays TaxID=4577 RepID=A0A3L6DH86_MAIZE|nr:Fanconi-associated nuclease 1 [Zea mays]
MLTGRESLVRLIGRRRRSPLPASLAAVLSLPSPSPSASLAQADDGGGSGEAAGGEAGSTSGGSRVIGMGAEWVVCPVCGDSIRGSDYCVNTHLDMCLTRGTKRKLTQSTLLNFQFSKKVSAEPTINNLNNESETENMKQIDEGLSSDQAFFAFDSEIGSSKAGTTISSPTYAKDAINDGAGELPTVATSCSFDECAVMDSSTVVVVDTVIVGRRFHENIELREDADITFMRDPQNAKDPDAIKGSVVGLHEQQFGNVPIQITIQKWPWFRKGSISYQEISDLEHAVMELELAGYIDMLSCTIDPFEYDMKEILDVLSVPEMKEILKELPKDNTICTHRHELVSTLLSSYRNGTCASLPKRILKWTGTCIRISKMADELLWRIQRLFFLNGDQDLSSFLLVESGIVKFPDYVCSISHRIFQERNDLLEYEDAIRVAQVMDESLDNNKMDLVTRCIDLSENRLCIMPKRENATTPERLPSFFSRFSASWVYSKILTLGVSVYERDRRYEDAVRILKTLLSTVACDRRRGYWALRLSIDLEHMGRPNESLSTAEGGATDPWVRAGSKFALQRRVLRLSKPPRRWKVPSYADYVKRNIREVSIEGRPLNCETGAKNVFYGYDGELCGVEQLALQYYADEGGGWQDIQDVFQSKFQTAPLDLGTDDFYKSRENIAESQLKRIRDGMAEEMLISSWELHQGTSCQGVNWARYSLTDLRAVVACVGGHRLASLLRHLAVDYRSWSSGMPDLLLWRFLDERGGGEAKLVEVKGPRDQLSEQQRAWILVLMDFGFDVEVCKVSPVTKRR